MQAPDPEKKLEGDRIQWVEVTWPDKADDRKPKVTKWEGATLDPLRLRERLPRALVLRLFAAFALLVRRRTAASEGAPDAAVADFPVEAARDDAIDWLALCRRPR